MTEEIDEFEMRDEAPRPKFLAVLCILTFISTGAGLLSTLVTMLMGASTEDEMMEAKIQMTQSINEMKDLGMDSFADMMYKIQAMTEDINAHHYLASTIAVLTVALGLYGALKMWKGFKIGFHMYIIYCLLSVGGLYLYVSPENIPAVLIIFNMLFSGLFIFMYSRNLKWLR